MARESERRGRLRFAQPCTILLLVVCVGVLAAMYELGLSNSPMSRPAPVALRYPSGVTRPSALWGSNVAERPTINCAFITVSLVSPRKDSIKVGDMIHYQITCRHENGTVLGSGGDFWYVTLVSKANPKASTAGRIVDHNNGTYSVYAVAGWAGHGTITVIRVLSSEAVEFMNNTVWPADDRVVWKGNFRVPDAKTQPSGLCMLRSHGNWTGMCVYPNENALGKTVFLCQKPQGVDCRTLYSTKSDGKRISARVKELRKGTEALFERTKLPPKIRIDVPVVNMSGPPIAAAVPTISSCQPDQKLPLSHGYWLQGSWHSLICQIQDWTEKEKLTSCLRHKNINLFGDSTTRQWFVHILELLDRKFVRRPGDLAFIWRRNYEDIDMSILLSFPKQLVGSATVLLEEVFYEVDLIDELNDTKCNYIVMVSPWAHFTQWTRESYVDRTEKLREALIRLRKRCPLVKIVLKGPHPRDHKSSDAQIYSSDIILKGIGEINQRILGGIGVWHLPIWDMNLAYPVPNTIHMPGEVIHEEVKMFLSYVCGENQVLPLET